MLKTIDEKQIFDLPRSRKKDFDRWRKQLSDHDYNIIRNQLFQRIDSDNIHTSSWIPGSNWHGTVFEPLYHATNKNQTHAAFFFGLVLWQVMIDHDELWYFHKTENIKGTIYFKRTI